jgi:hypothetical protein
LLVVGLGAYAFTQLVEAVCRPSHAGSTIGRWRQRAVSSWDLTAVLLRTGSGRLLLGGVGVLIVAAGVEVGRRSVRLDFRERFFAEHMSWPLAIITRALGAFGCAVRSVVFVLVGVFIIKAAALSDAKQTKGLDAVFRSVASTGDGSWLWRYSRAASSATGCIACSRLATAT